jgi:hypothetical protein
MNVLTLLSLTAIFKREVNALRAGQKFVLAPGDYAFLNSQSPSFMDNFNSILSLVN